MCHVDDDSTISAIDFGGLESAINVQSGGRIEFRGVSLRQPAPQRWSVINDTYLINTGFAALPSINTAPNATVSMLVVLKSLPYMMYSSKQSSVVISKQSSVVT